MHAGFRCADVAAFQIVTVYHHAPQQSRVTRLGGIAGFCICAAEFVRVGRNSRLKCKLFYRDCNARVCRRGG